MAVVVGDGAGDRAYMPGDRQLERHKLLSTGDGVAWGLMTGMGETYLPAFALALGLGEVTSGLVASVPMAVGGWLQLLAPWGVRRVGSARRWVVLCVILQSISFFPLIYAAVQGSASALLVFGATTAYWVTGLASSPTWNLWIGRLIPHEIRSTFFASRTRWAQFATLTGFVLGGVTLHLAKQGNWLFPAFILIFCASVVTRLLSGFFLAQHADTAPESNVATTETAPNPKLFQANVRLLAYLGIVQVFAQFSGPYFTPYILKQLEYSYLPYVGLIGCSYVAKACSLPFWGRYAQKHGAWALLNLGGLGIIPLAAMWIPTNSFWFLACNQVAAGILWGAYELAFFLLFFESIPEQRRAQWLTWYNVVNSTAWALGAIGGGLLLRSLGTSVGAYHLLFAGSTLGRGLAWWFCFPLSRQARLATNAGKMGGELTALAVELEPATPLAEKLQPSAVATANESAPLEVPARTKREPVAA